MTDQLADLSDPPPVSAAPTSTSSGSSTKHDTVPTLRLTGTRKCPSCDGDAPAHASVCPQCGDMLQAKSKKIRCRRCGNSATSALVICPFCGRELQAAPPRLITWGAPLVVVGLFFLLLFSRWNGENPIVWVQLQLSDGFARAGVLGDNAEQGTIIVMTPIAGDRDAGDRDAGDRDAGDRDAGDHDEVANAVEDRESGVAAVPDSQATMVVAGGDNMQDPLPEDNGDPGDGDQADGMTVLTPPTTDSLSETPVPTVNPSEEISSTESPPTSDELPTEVLTATQASATSGLDKVVPAVKALSQNLPTATPPITATETVRPTAPPTETSTSTPEPSPTPTPKRRTYKIKAGDTLLGISSQFGVDVEILMKVNDIAPTDAYLIQPGETIVIPEPGEKVADPATPTPSAPSTQAQAAPSKPTVMPIGGVSLIRLDAPMLRSPENGTPASCSSPISLVWLAVPYIRADDKFIVHLGFFSGRSENNEEIVTWVLEQPRPANVTSWDVDGNLCGLASQDFGRQWRWWVEVAEDVGGDMVSVSPPSEIWGFSWN